MVYAIIYNKCVMLRLLFLLLVDVLTADMIKDVPGSMMFADDIVLCGDDETDMTECIRGQRHEDQQTKNPIHRL